MNRLRRFIPSITHIILLFAAMMWVSCENSLTVIKEITREDTLAAVTAHDIVYIRSDSGQVFMQLKAPVMLRYSGEDPTIEFPEGFEAIFLDSLQQPSSRIEAKYGISHENTELMFARDEVVVENFQTKEILYTETLFWNQKKKIIYTRASVKITAPDKVIYGDSLTAAENFSTREIYNIRATLEIEENEDEN
ncbi:MAG: LPS export ABC transporter periplasmic protein LptC [Bacteroidales bacterium]|nr:LPS export ABC transporter periplasmic protein LptC [Bacteroidales bacterium]MDP2237078.1 LPS export ABC transporter periplasmic protein LptC [Bacteroidales bacterium]